MGEGARPGRPQAVLFACGHQFGALADGGRRCSSRLFGAALYVASAGVRKGELDPFAVAAMEEIGIDIAAHRPMTFEELEDWEGLNFDLIVTLSPEAHHRALELTRTARRRGRVLADPRSDRPGRQPRAAARRLSRGARPADGAHPRALRLGRHAATNDGARHAIPDVGWAVVELVVEWPRFR